MARSELVEMRTDFSLAASAICIKARELKCWAAINECKRSDEQAIINASGEYGRKAIVVALRVAGFGDLAAAISNNGAANGIRNSLHEQGLAMDVLLYDEDGGYLADGPEYRALGEWWEGRDRRACWGGRFGDPGHFSFGYQGKK
jgi:hypothetical protein